MTRGRLHKLISGAAVVLFAVGCASTPSSPVSMEQALSGMIGQKTDIATSRLGPAGSIHAVRGGTQYVWVARAAAGAPQGSNSAINKRGAEVAAALRSNPNAVHPTRPCTITMMADRNGFIQTFRISGEGSCDSFSRSLGATH